MTATTIHYHLSSGPGWIPILHMVRLACRLIGADLRDTSGLSASRLSMLKLGLFAPRGGGDRGAIFIARGAGDIARLVTMPDFSAPRRFRALWIIDSFWTDHLPHPRVMSRFDLIAYTQSRDRDVYESLYGDRALFLGWGADVLDLGGPGGERPWDVLRVGRQPPEWEDDEKSAAACTARGLRFHGRPPFAEDRQLHQQSLMQDWYARTKFVIAHSNLVAPASYTHPTKEYISARWTDALASGASIAGRQPRSDLDLLDWPEAVLDFESTRLEDNLDLLRRAVQGWTPGTARKNHLGALRRLDWRWRIDALAGRLGIRSAALDAEMRRLRQAIADLERATTGDERNDGGQAGALQGGVRECRR